jgi:hypothetical protein
MMSPNAREILSRVEGWPQEDQDELAEVARDIEARRRGLYQPTAEEEETILGGLTELERGDWTSEEAMRAFWVRCGVL